MKTRKALPRPVILKLRTRGKCATVKTRELKGGKTLPPADRGACELESKSQGSE